MGACLSRVAGIKLGSSQLKRLLFICIFAGTAVSQSAYALEANSDVSIQVCDASATLTITSPADGTATNKSSVTVSGYGPASASVDVFRNDSQIGAVTTGSDGFYSTSVPLVKGANVLRTSSTDACGQVIQSNSVTVYRRQTSKNQQTANLNSNGQPDDSSPVAAEEPVHKTAQPTITEPRDGQETSNPSLILRGTAQPGARVKITLNGRAVAEVTADDAGYFAVSINLTPGRNTLIASVFNGSAEVISRTVSITYHPAAVAGSAKPLSNPWLITISLALIGLAAPLIGLIVRRRRRRAAMVRFASNGTPNARF